MKKLLALVLAVVMMLGIASVAFAETAAAPTSLQAVLDAGVLKVGVDAAFAPMTFKDAEGNWVGFDVELATAVAAKLGVAVEFVPVDWANLAGALADGTIDCVWSGMSVTDDRKAVMTVSSAYLASDATILVHGEVAGFIEDLAGKKIGVQAGSFTETLLRDLVPAEDIVLFPDSDAAVAAFTAKVTADAAAEAAEDAEQSKSAEDAAAEAVQEALHTTETEEAVTVDAVILDSVYAAYQLATNEALAECITIEDLYEDLFVIGFQKGDYLLCGTIEEILFDLSADGTVGAIAETWFGADITLIGK